MIFTGENKHASSLIKCHFLKHHNQNLKKGKVI